MYFCLSVSISACLSVSLSLSPISHTVTIFSSCLDGGGGEGEAGLPPMSHKQVIASYPTKAWSVCRPCPFRFFNFHELHP